MENDTRALCKMIKDGVPLDVLGLSEEDAKSYRRNYPQYF